jgi:Transcriptional regulators
MKKVITIKDVARETKLAISTISKYMNGGNVRKENRILIEEVVKRLGYQPNKAARGLRSAKTYTIGLVMNYTESQYFSKMAACIESFLQQKGYSLLLAGHQDNPKQAEGAIRFLANEQVDGCFVVALTGIEEYLYPLEEAGIPLLLLDRAISGEENRYDSVMSNGARGTYEAIEYLLEKRHRDIAIITGMDKEKNKAVVAAKDRLRGYERAFEDYGVQVNEEFVLGGDFSYQSGYEEMHKLWKKKNKPTALFVTNYNMALGALAAIHEIGITVPEDLSVVMFDDLEFSVVNRPKMTAVHQSIEKIAEQAAMTLLRRINGDLEGYPQQIRLRTTFKERESVRELHKNE